MTSQQAPLNLKILSIDGGGIRGLSSLLLLQSIMFRVGNQMNPRQPDIQPWQYFDIIGGTSTGGIIAIMLGRLRMTIEECIAEYERLGAMVFGEKKIGGEEMFKATKLEAAIKDVIVKKLGKGMEDAPLLDPLGDECCKTIVFALPAAHPNSIQAQPFRTYFSTYQKNIPCTIWQAARAASAAPTFFKPMRLGTPAKEWIDAGIKFNNPGHLIKAEAGEIWGDAEGRLDLTRHVGCFLSLGTGLPEVTRLWDKNGIDSTLAKVGLPKRAIEVMKSIATDTERVAYELAELLPDTIFFRYNVEQGLQAVQLFDYEKIEDISADTDNYITKMKTSITRCAGRMALFSRNPWLLAAPTTNQRLIEAPDIEQDTIVQRQLEDLQIDKATFDHYRKKDEKSKKYSDRLRGISYLWLACIMADVLEKEGRDILDRFIEKGLPEGGAPNATDKAPEEENENNDQRSQVISRVLLQNEGNEKIYLAFQLYLELKPQMATYFDEESVEWLWVTNRLAGVSALLGLKQEASEMYDAVIQGRTKILGEFAKATCASVKYKSALDA